MLIVIIFPYFLSFLYFFYISFIASELTVNCYHIGFPPVSWSSPPILFKMISVIYSHT